MATLEELSFNISWACRTSFVSASSWDDKTCKSSWRSVAVTKTHLIVDDKMILELSKSSKQYFVSLSIYSNMSSVTCFWYQSFWEPYCENHFEPLKEVMLHGYVLIDLLTIVLNY